MSRKKLPTRFCDECAHYLPNGWQDSTLCAKGHKPRWYDWISPMSDDWGHKRKCEDFQEKNPTPRPNPKRSLIMSERNDLVSALKPFADFYERLTDGRRGYPETGTLYAIDTGAETEVEITMEDLRMAHELFHGLASVSREDLPERVEWGEVSEVDGKPYFRHDFDSCESHESQDIYYQTQEMLEAIGWMIENPFIEHDCLTGTLVPIDRKLTVNG